MKKPMEKDVLASCLRLLRLAGVFAWRNNSGGTYLPGHGERKQFVRFGLVGSSDILAVLPPGGKLLACECKRPGGKPNAFQVAFLDAVTTAGGLAVVVSDVKQLEQVLKLEGVL